MPVRPRKRTAPRLGSPPELPFSKCEMTSSFWKGTPQRCDQEPLQDVDLTLPQVVGDQRFGVGREIVFVHASTVSPDVHAGATPSCATHITPLCPNQETKPSLDCMNPMIVLSITLAGPLAIRPPRFIALSIALRQRRPISAR